MQKASFHCEESHKSCFCVWRMGRGRIHWINIGPCKVPSAGGIVLTVSSCSPWRGLLSYHRRLFFLHSAGTRTNCMFCLKQKSQRPDISCVCCQQNLCQGYMESQWLAVTRFDFNLLRSEKYSHPILVVIVFLLVKNSLTFSAD